MSWLKKLIFFSIFIQQNKSVNYNDRRPAKKSSTKSIKLIKKLSRKERKTNLFVYPSFLLLQPVGKYLINQIIAEASEK